MLGGVKIHKAFQRAYQNARINFEIINIGILKHLQFNGLYWPPGFENTIFNEKHTLHIHIEIA